MWLIELVVVKFGLRPDWEVVPVVRASGQTKQPVVRWRSGLALVAANECEDDSSQQTLRGHKLAQALLNARARGWQ